MTLINPDNRPKTIGAELLERDLEASDGTLLVTPSDTDVGLNLPGGLYQVAYRELVGRVNQLANLAQPEQRLVVLREVDALLEDLLSIEKGENPSNPLNLQTISPQGRFEVKAPDSQAIAENLPSGVYEETYDFMSIGVNGTSRMPFSDGRESMLSSALEKCRRLIQMDQSRRV